MTFFSFLFEIGLTMELWLAWIYVNQGIFKISWASCLGLLSPGIIVVCLNTLLDI